MHTEEQAKTKWCPERRFFNGSVALNVDSMGGEAKCIASGCMHWRWMDGQWDASGYSSVTHGADGLPRGFCGLSGVPR